MPDLRTTGTKFRQFRHKFLNSIRSKGIISSIIFAVALWFYVSLNNTFSLFISVPLKVITNEDQAIETVLPKTINVEIKGKGWDLFNEKYLIKSGYCLIDISNFSNSETSIFFPYSKLIHSFNSMDKFEIKSINPENLTFLLSKISKKTRPIVSNIKITPRLGFTLVGNVELVPNEVLAKGHSHILDTLDNFSTIFLNLKDAHSDISGTIPISDTLYPIVKINPVSIKYFAKIQYASSIKLTQIPIKIRGGSLSNGIIIQPKYITIYITGGVDELAKILPGDVSAYIEYESIINDSTGNLIPTIEFPRNLKLLKTEPPFVYHYNYKSGLLF